MNLNPTMAATTDMAPIRAAPRGPDTIRAGGNDEVREQFASVMGELLFTQMLKSMRKTVGKPAYFHGGRAEEVFTQQLDQVLAEKIAKNSAEKFVGPMYELFMLNRK